MKKTLAILMLAVFMLSLVSCGGGKTENTDPIAAAAETYGLDLASTEEQQMSAERTTREKLNQMVHEYLKGNNYFDGTELENVTYADLKEQLGVDASYYYFEDALVSKQSFVWIAGDNDKAKFIASFSEGKLYATGSTNVG